MKWLYVIFICPLIALWVIWNKIIYPVFIGSLLEVYRAATAQKDAPTHGSADWASNKQLKKAGHYEPYGFLMAVTKKGRKRVFTHRERSAIILAPPGMGKTQTLIANLRAIEGLPEGKRPFLVIGDPAGDLFAASAKRLSELGYAVGQIDLVRPDMGTNYDILSFLKPSDRFGYDRDLRALTELLVPDEAGSKQPHFVEFARILLRGVITVDVKYEGNARTLSELVRELIVESKREAMIERVKAYSDDYVREALELFERMQNKPEGMSMMSTIMRKLDVWNDAAIEEVSRFGPDMHGKPGRGWDWEKVFVYERPTAMFIRAGLGTGGAYSRVVYGNAINSVRRIWNNTGKPLPRDLKLIIDEAATVGNCNAVMDGHNELRKAGVRVMLCFLSMKALRDTYPEAETLWNGCDVVVYGQGKDHQLYKEISGLIGDKTIENRSVSESDESGSRSFTEQARLLIKPEELRQLPYEECVALLGSLTMKGLKPFERTKQGIRYL